MLRTVDRQLGAVQRQITDINRRMASWDTLGTGGGTLLTDDWTNSTVAEVVEVNRTTVYETRKDGGGFSFVHSVRKTKADEEEEEVVEEDSLDENMKTKMEEPAPGDVSAVEVIEKN